MKQNDKDGLIPENRAGKQIDSEARIDADTQEQAGKLFREASARLLDVNHWHELAGPLSARFQLVDRQGKEVSRPVQQGDYFQIDIPGPGTKTGEGYDWAEVESLEISSFPERTGIRVRPAANPRDAKASISHFYSDESTSTFLVTRNGRTVIAGVYDRNTKPNDKTADAGLIETVRDKIVGAGGVTVFSKIQWQKLVNGVLQSA